MRIFGAGGNCSRIACLLMGAAMTVGVSCQTIEEMAPPVDTVFIDRANVGEADGMVDRLRQGRVVYLTDCGRCHGVEPIDRYSETKWRQILPRMAFESRLDAAEAKALEAYVLTAHVVMERGKERGE